MFEALIRRFLPRAWQQVEQRTSTAIINQTTTQRIQNGIHNGFVSRIAPATVQVGLNSYALFEPHSILTSTSRAICSLKAGLYQQYMAETQLQDDTAIDQDMFIILPNQAEVAGSPDSIRISHQGAELLTDTARDVGPTPDAHHTACTYDVVQSSLSHSPVKGTHLIGFQAVQPATALEAHGGHGEQAGIETSDESNNNLAGGIGNMTPPFYTPIPVPEDQAPSRRTTQLREEAFDELLEAGEDTAENTDSIRPSTSLPWSIHHDADALPHDRPAEVLYAAYNTDRAFHEPARLETIPEEDESLSDNVPGPLVKYTKNHYTSPEGEARLDYIKDYISLHPATLPAHLVFFFIEPGRQRTLRQAAWDNPAFLRATLEIDFDGILHGIPWPTENSNPYLEYYWNLMEAWLESGAQLLTDEKNETLPLKEWDCCIPASWEQLLEYVEEELPTDSSLVKRWVEKWDGADRNGGVRRREWVGHGPSRLRTVTVVDEQW
ncbi:hypothetical protein GE09DRAFT_1232694 [Coniochaeta sp. 2T2.1]|nr:hypothetical protein GE09DRAFT_1232694 [Coniochaeta sp. 2T2.1]